MIRAAGTKPAFGYEKATSATINRSLNLEDMRSKKATAASSSMAASNIYGEPEKKSRAGWYLLGAAVLAAGAALAARHNLLGETMKGHYDTAEKWVKETATSLYNRVFKKEAEVVEGEAKTAAEGATGATAAEGEAKTAAESTAVPAPDSKPKE